MLTEPKIPSKELKNEWIWAKTIKPHESQLSNEFSGKWMIFASLRRMDDGLTVLDHLWKRIQAETLLKKLYKASARTAKKTPLSRGDYSVICVHTTDYRNEGEVLLTGIKILHILKAMPMSMESSLCKTLAYKTYEETLNKENPGLNLYKLYYLTERKIKFLKLNNERARDYERDYNDECYDVIFESNLEEAVLTLLPNANTLKFRENHYLKVMNGFHDVRQHVLNYGKESASDSSDSSSDSSDSELDNSLRIDVAAEQAIPNSKKRSNYLLDDADKQQVVDSKKFKE